MKLKFTIFASLVMAGILLAACPVDNGNNNTGGAGLAAPVGLTVTDTASTRIDLAWTAVSGAAKYRVYYSVTPTGIYSYVDETVYASYRVSGLVPQHTYYYKVSAVDSSGIEGPQSVYASGTTKEQGIPVPGSVRASAVSSNSIQVNWNTVTGANNYKVYRNTASSGSYSFLTTVAGTVTSHTDAGLSPSSNYWYMVSAETSQGESEQGGPAHAATPAEGVVPAPSGLQVSSVSGSSVSFSWNTVPEATGYNVYRSNAVSGPFTTPIGTSSTASYTDSGLSYSTAYYYTVSTIHSKGESEKSSVLSAVTTAQPSIPAPGGVSATLQANNSVQVSWNTVSGAANYKVYRSNSANGLYTQIGIAASSPYTDSGLSGGATLYYKVSAVGSNDQESDLSVLVSVAIPQAPQTPPGNTLAEQLAYIRNNAGDGTVFEIVLNNNEYMGPTTVGTLGRNITVNIRSANPTNVRSIQLESVGHLFTVDNNVTLKLQDIVLIGMSANNRALVLVSQGGKLLLNSGAKITLNTNTGDINGGGIRVNGGILELDEGSEITGNTVRSNSPHGGGIYVENSSTVVMRGGTISENIVYGNTSSWSSYAYGGGIHITGNSTVTMSGGIISKNTASTYWYNPRGAGGIYIANGSNFIKRAASGSVTSGIIYGTSGDNANTSEMGNVIYRDFSTLRSRKATLGYYDEISSNSDVGWE